MPVAVQAVPFLIALGVLGVPLVLSLGPWGALPPFLLALFVAFFFRDPERRSPEGEGLVLSPADGQVTTVESSPAGTRISIFLSLLNCHINRAPVSGVVREARHTAGRYRPAWQARASLENERNHLEIQSGAGHYGVTQVAGVLARRIVCTKRPGDRVQRGERIGMIRFGSRTDLRLPPGTDPLVSVGDRVRAGISILARERANRAAASAGLGGA